MEQIIEITEIHLENGLGNRLKISGTDSKEKALEPAIHWADENNCMVTDIVLHEEGGDFTAAVYSGDYE